MMKSMTGYGKGEAVLYNRKFSVEIKSVNHRYSDINLKMPRIMNPFEDRIRQILSSEIARGKVDVYVNYESFSAEDAGINLNEALAAAYVEKLRYMKDKFQLPDDVTLALLTRLPDVISVEKNIENEQTISQMWEAMEAALKSAMGSFGEMRLREGKALRVDLFRKNDIIKSLSEKISERSPLVSEEYREKLLAKMKEILSGAEIDESRILTEAALFADKNCIDEEITRLKSHIGQMESILNESGSVGRKLDFLVQEMNREANTIGSKSNDMEITRLVVELKSEIEKIREQVQNIE